MPNGPDPYLTESEAPTWPGHQAAPPPYVSPASAPYNNQAPYASYAPYPPAAAPQQQPHYQQQQQQQYQQQQQQQYQPQPWRGRRRAWGGVPAGGGPRLGLMYRLALLVSFALSIVEALLVVRIALELLAANPEAYFTSLILGLTDPLVAPFQGVFPTLAALQGHALDTAALLALVVYALAARVLIAAMRLVSR